MFFKQKQGGVMCNERVKEIWAKVGKAKTINEVYLLLAEMIGYPFFMDDPSYLLPNVLVYKGEDTDPDMMWIPKKINNEIWSTPVGEIRRISRKNDTLIVEHKFGQVPCSNIGERRYFEISVVLF